MIHLRKASAADSRVIREMVRNERLNPLGLDWQRFLLAVLPGAEVVGCVQIKQHSDGTRELASLLVKSDYRGKGLARCLIENILATQQPPLYLMCRGTLEPLYTRFGFRSLAAEELPGYYWRIHAAFGFLSFFLRRSENLSIMKWE